MASCSASGPGSTWTKFKARRNSSSSIHFSRSTTWRCIRPIWPTGPPKASQPSLRKYQKMSAIVGCNCTTGLGGRYACTIIGGVARDDRGGWTICTSTSGANGEREGATSGFQRDSGPRAGAERLLVDQGGGGGVLQRGARAVEDRD